MNFINKLPDITKHISEFRIGVVTSIFNYEITSVLESGALKYLIDIGCSNELIFVVHVPGAFEIPLIAEQLLEANCDGIITLGSVIRGETDHYDYVCNAVQTGCSWLALNYKRPVVFGVLTTDTAEQAIARTIGSHGNKGRDAAEVVIEMIKLNKKIKTLFKED